MRTPTVLAIRVWRVLGIDDRARRACRKIAAGSSSPKSHYVRYWMNKTADGAVFRLV
jgi:hypothetical protein